VQAAAVLARHEEGLRERVDVGGRGRRRARGGDELVRKEGGRAVEVLRERVVRERAQRGRGGGLHRWRAARGGGGCA
jgi:hypothetical protein